MTRKERLRAVIDGNISEELVADCQRELEKLEAKEAERKATPTENQLANKLIENSIVDLLSHEAPLTIEQINEEVGRTYTRQKLTAICTNLVRRGILESEKIKVKGKGERVAYRLA